MALMLGSPPGRDLANVALIAFMFSNACLAVWLLKNAFMSLLKQRRLLDYIDYELRLNFDYMMAPLPVNRIIVELSAFKTVSLRSLEFSTSISIGILNKKVYISQFY